MNQFINIIKYLLLIVIGIIIYYILNRKDGFSIGIPDVYLIDVREAGGGMGDDYGADPIGYPIGPFQGGIDEAQAFLDANNIDGYQPGEIDGLPDGPTILPAEWVEEAEPVLAAVQPPLEPAPEPEVECLPNTPVNPSYGRLCSDSEIAEGDPGAAPAGTEFLLNEVEESLMNSIITAIQNEMLSSFGSRVLNSCAVASSAGSRYASGTSLQLAAQRLAFAEGYHARLGAGSIISGLSEDLYYQIVQNIIFNVVTNFQAWIQRLKEQVVCINRRDMPAADEETRIALSRAYISGTPPRRPPSPSRAGQTQIVTTIPEALRNNLNSWAPHRRRSQRIIPEMRGGNRGLICFLYSLHLVARFVFLEMFNTVIPTTTPEMTGYEFLEIVLDHFNAIILRDIIFGLYRPDTLFFNFQSFQEFVNRIQDGSLLFYTGIVNFMMPFIHNIMYLLIHVYERAKYLGSIHQTFDLSDAFIKQLVETFLYNGGWLKLAFNMPGFKLSNLIEGPRLFVPDAESRGAPRITINMPYFDIQISPQSTINLSISGDTTADCIFQTIRYDYRRYLFILLMMYKCIEYELLLPAIIPYLMTENILHIFENIYLLIERFAVLRRVFERGGERGAEYFEEQREDLIDQIVDIFVTENLKYFLVDDIRTRLLAPYYVPHVRAAVPDDLMSDVRNLIISIGGDQVAQGLHKDLFQSLIDLYNAFYPSYAHFQSNFDLAIYDAQGVTRYAMQIYLIMMGLYLRQHE